MRVPETPVRYAMLCYAVLGARGRALNLRYPHNPTDDMPRRIVVCDSTFLSPVARAMLCYAMLWYAGGSDKPTPTLTLAVVLAAAAEPAAI